MSVSQDPRTQNVQMQMMNPNQPGQMQVKTGQNIPLTPVQQQWAQNFSEVKQITLKTDIKVKKQCCGLCCTDTVNYTHVIKDQGGREIAKFDEITVFPKIECCSCKDCCKCKCSCFSCCKFGECCTCFKCPDIFVYSYAKRNISEGHIFNQHAKIEIRTSGWGDKTGKLLHGESIQAVSEVNDVVNLNNCKLCRLVPDYTNVSLSANNNSIINRVTHSAGCCTHYCKQSISVDAGIPSDMRTPQIDYDVRVDGQKWKNYCKCLGYFGDINLDLSNIPNEQKANILLNLVHCQYDTVWTPSFHIESYKNKLRK